MAPPDATSRSIQGTRLEEEECARARCDAATLLQSFGRADAGRVEEECAVFRPVCGNEVLEPGEACDDGANGRVGDGCRDDCTVERCGDDIVDPGEDCDTSDPDLRRDCTLECRTCDGCNLCGDGVVGLGEACDDGNLIDDDGCSSLCEVDGLI